VADAEKTIMDALASLLERRDGAAPEVRPGSSLQEDLDLDSLEVAELSVILEDELGDDPFSQGILPNTVGELLAYYKS
jgi:acyl carrier protein